MADDNSSITEFLAAVRDLFESSGFYSFVAKENFYPTIRDAVAIAKERQNELVYENLCL